MNRSRIELEDGTCLPLSDEIALSLNYAIADIREPERRDANYSKTIDIPGSKEADTFFKSAFRIDGYNNYNPNLKKGARIYTDDIEQMNGFLQLLNVGIDDTKITYSVNIKGNVSNVFQEWGDQELTALDLSAYDHTYNKTTQKASWSATTGQGYVYPMIDLGLTNGLTYDVEHFAPAIYAKEYIDKAMALAGYTYSSNFLNSAFFKRLIIPYNGQRLILTDAQVAPRIFSAELVATQSSTAPPSGIQYVPINIEYDTVISDVSGQFNTGTHLFTAGFPGSYNIGSTFDFSVTSASGFTLGGNIAIKKISGGVTTTVASGAVPGAPLSVSSFSATASLMASNIDLAVGDQLYVQFQMFVSNLATINIDITGGTFSNSVNNTGLFDGDAVDMNSAIPQKIKIKDFVTSIIKMFNLYVETDKTITKKLYIEPRNDFYASGQTINWTSKLSIDKRIDIKPIGELTALRYEFTYKEDKDFFNTKYKDAHQRVFGSYEKDIENDFLKGVSKNEIIFSPTPLCQMGTTDRVLSQIVGVDSTGNVTKLKSFNLRILYYAGTKTTSNPWTYTGTASGTTTESTYPYAGHLDNPLSPTLDLNFGVPFEDYYITTSYTNNNLFNKYHSKQVFELTDKDSKVVTCYLNLSPRDIQTLDFRNQFFIDTHFLRLNKIFDYNPVSVALTKCEFIKIKDVIDFTPETISSLGGSGVIFSNGDPIPTNRPTFNIATGVIAFGNYVDPSVRSCIVTGTGNHIGAGCSSISLLGCRNCSVIPGLSNVTLRNCDGLEITESDVSYSNNEIEDQNNTWITESITIPAADVAVSNSVPYLLVSPTIGKVIDCNEAALVMVFNTTAYTTFVDGEIFIDTCGVTQMEIKNGLITTVTRALKFMPTDTSTAAAGDTQFKYNKGLYYRTATGDPPVGDSDVTIVVTYRLRS